MVPIQFLSGLTFDSDLADINLACANGLPGGQTNLPACKTFLDEASAQVSRETAKLRYRFDKNPAEFQHSIAFFKLDVMFTVLQRDLGVRYNADLIDKDDFFKDARNLFIHGICENRQGTCNSLPTFYAAVGRRLGYPMKLVGTKSHHFLRWDGQGDYFNIESTCQGLVTYPDEHYLSWPYPSSPEEVKKYGFMKSKTPPEELAYFLTVRGHCWFDNHELGEAVHAYAWATELASENHMYSGQLCHAMDRWDAHLRQMIPPGFPEMSVNPIRPFKNIPMDLQKAIVLLDVVEAALKKPQWADEWWTPLRQNRQPANLPARIIVHLPRNRGERTRFELIPRTESTL